MRSSIEHFDFSSLSSKDRLHLAQALLDSVLCEGEDEIFTPAQLEELDRRLADMDSGKVVCEPWETVRERLLKG